MRNGASLSNLREGYPWLYPSHKGHPANDMLGPTEIMSLGLRWQSLIVSPGQLPWMKLPEVPADTKYAWWTGLRSVPCSYISSRGEAERFLFYDGPTLAKAPINVSLRGQALDVSVVEEEQLRRQGPATPPPQWEMRESNRYLLLRTGLLVRVAEESVTLQVMDLPNESGRIELSRIPVITGLRNVERAFLDLLVERGLTEAEARGMLESWPQFFQRPGTRFLTVLSWDDYNWYLPMRVEPQPTQVVRVGVLLTENLGGEN